jgi:hypothetical protein
MHGRPRFKELGKCAWRRQGLQTAQPPADASPAHSACTCFSCPTCSIEAWVQLDDDLDVIRESTVVAFGPFSLQLKAPGTPQLLIRPTATTFDAGYKLFRDSRGNCGNLELISSQTASIIEAARICTVTPGGLASLVPLPLACRHAAIGLW